MKQVKNFFRQLNVADYFSLYRVAAVPFIIASVVLDARAVTGILLLVSFLTDAIDGYIARKKNIASSRGALLDSIGDLLTLVSGFAALIVFETSFIREHLWILILSFSLFFLQMIISLIKFKKISSYHTYLAKITAVLFALLLVITPLAGPVRILFFSTFAVSIAEALEEIVITFILKEPKENVKGLYWILKKD